MFEVILRKELHGSSPEDLLVQLRFLPLADRPLGRRIKHLNRCDFIWAHVWYIFDVIGARLMDLKDSEGS